VASPSGASEGRQVSVEPQSSVPAMPKVPSSQLYRGTPYLLMESGLRYSLGWQDDRKAGPSFVVARLSPLDTIKVRERFPLTQEGWASAWQALCRADEGAAAAIMPKLIERAERHRTAATFSALDAESLCCLRNLTFKGASGDVPLVQGRAYDLRFLGDRLIVCAPASLNAVIDVPYREVEAVEISGPGETGKSAGEMAVLIIALGGIGALLGLLLLGPVGLLLGAVALGLVGALIGTSTRTETTVRVRSARAEYFFLHGQRSPDALRMDLSGPLRVIDAARTSPSAGSDEPAETTSGSMPDQLSKLASLLEQGLITRDEFDRLKAKVIADL